MSIKRRIKALEARIGAQRQIPPPLIVCLVGYPPKGAVCPKEKMLVEHYYSNGGQYIGVAPYLNCNGCEFKDCEHFRPEGEAEKDVEEP